MRSSKLFLLIVLLITALVTPALGQDWNVQLVDDSGNVGHYSQIVVLSDGTPYIAYAAGGVLRLAWWLEEGNESGWQFTDLGYAGYKFGMCVDSNDMIHIVWTYSYHAPKYGIYDPATESWALAEETITGLLAYSTLDLVLIEDGSDITPHIAANKQNEKVFACERDPGTGVWTVEEASSVYDCYGTASIGIDSQGGKHVSFYEPDGDNLMYSVKAAGGTEWLLQTVDIEDNVGEYSAIVVDDNDDIHIAYYDRTNGDLKFATTTTP